MSRQVIINADDFGLSPAINDGIIKAYQSGGITSTSMMVNMPGFDHAVHAAQSLPDFGIGLHFNLTYGCPVCDPGSVSSLVKKMVIFITEIVYMYEIPLISLKNLMHNGIGL